MNYYMIIEGVIIVVLGIIVGWGFMGASNMNEFKDNCKQAIWFLLVMPIAIGIVVCAFGFKLILNGGVVERKYDTYQHM